MLERGEVARRARDVNVYRCPVCSNEYRTDELVPAMCTGPGQLDSHPMKLMVLDRTEVAARGPVFLPRGSSSLTS